MGQRSTIKAGIVSALTSLIPTATVATWNDVADIENGTGTTIHVRYIGFDQQDLGEIGLSTYERTYLYELVVAADTADACEALLDSAETGLSGKMVGNAGPAKMAKHPNGPGVEFALDNIHGRCAFIQCWALSDIESHALS